MPRPLTYVKHEELVYAHPTSSPIHADHTLSDQHTQQMVNSVYYVYGVGVVNRTANDLFIDEWRVCLGGVVM